MKSQRDAAQDQRNHEAHDKLREERRVSFIGFLTAYQALASRAIEVAEWGELDRAQEKDHERMGDRRDAADRYADEERELFSRAYQELLLTAQRAETIDAAQKATATLWEMVRAASNCELEEFRAVEEQTRAPRRELRHRMRQELEYEASKRP